MSDLPSFEQPARPLDYLPGKVVVRVAPDAVRPHLDEAGELPAGPGARERLAPEIAEPLDVLRDRAGVREPKPILSERVDAFDAVEGDADDLARLAGVVAASVTDPPEPELEGYTLGTVVDDDLPPDVVDYVDQSKVIDFVERMPARWLLAGTEPPDPARNLQWGLRAIGWFDADRPDASGTRIGVLDSGVDTSHPALRDLDMTYDHHGVVATDLSGHGTHIVGTIAAGADDDAGVAGIARPRLSIWKVMSDQPIDGALYIQPGPYVRALGAARTAGLDVVNISLGGNVDLARVEAAAIQQLRASGVNVVAAIGNAFLLGNPTLYPAAHPGVVSVGSIAEDGLRSPFSNTGGHIDLVAPGSNVLSTWPLAPSPFTRKRRYAVESGTSMAAAHVATALALVAAQHPDWSADDRVEHLRLTARRLPAMGKREWTPEYGSGLLDLRRALNPSAERPPPEA
jgi:subtilisin family serine protease